MMAIMDKITDKPDWDKKVFDDAIVQKWRLEALATEDVDVSEKMLDWVRTNFLQTIVKHPSVARLPSIIQSQRRSNRSGLCAASSEKLVRSLARSYVSSRLSLPSFTL